MDEPYCLLGGVFNTCLPQPGGADQPDHLFSVRRPDAGLRGADPEWVQAVHFRGRVKAKSIDVHCEEEFADAGRQYAVLVGQMMRLAQ